MSAAEILDAALDHEQCIIRVHGIPTAQGSKTAYVRSGRAVLVEGKSAKGRASHAAWRQAVATAARDWLDAHPMAATFDEAVRVCVRFDLPRPASVRRRLPTVKPDVDKLARATLDALVDSGLLLGDQLVTDLHVVKVYASRPGATISVRDAITEEFS